MFRSNVRIPIEFAIFLILLTIFIEPEIFSTSTSINIKNDILYQIISRIIQAILITLLCGGLFVEYLYDRYRESIFSFIDRIVYSSKNIENELRLIKNSHSKEIDRAEMAKILQNHNAIFRPAQRIRLDFYKICIQDFVQAHKLTLISDMRLKLSSAIFSMVKKRDINFDIIFSSNTLANKLLSSTIGLYTHDKPYFFYNLVKGDGAINISSDFRAVKNKGQLKVLVIESVLVTPKIVYKLLQCLDVLSDIKGINIVVVGVVTIFNGYGNNSKAFKDYPGIKYVSLFETNQNLLPSSDCVGCYVDRCVEPVPGIDKDIILL